MSGVVGVVVRAGQDVLKQLNSSRNASSRSQSTASENSYAESYRFFDINAVKNQTHGKGVEGDGVNSRFRRFVPEWSDHSPHCESLERRYLLSGQALSIPFFAANFSAIDLGFETQAPSSL